MSIQEAVQLVVDSSYLSRGGEVFVTKMPVIRIKDLAEVMINELAPKYGHQAEDIEIKIIGTKPGEKMYEELMSLEETKRSWELKRYFVVKPAFSSFYQNINYHYSDLVSKEVTNPYHSGNEKPLTKLELTAFLKRNKLLRDDSIETKHPDQRYWPNGEKAESTGDLNEQPPISAIAL